MNWDELCRTRNEFLGQGRGGNGPGEDSVCHGHITTGLSLGKEAAA